MKLRSLLASAAAFAMAATLASSSAVGSTTPPENVFDGPAGHFSNGHLAKAVDFVTFNIAYQLPNEGWGGITVSPLQDFSAVHPVGSHEQPTVVGKSWSVAIDIGPTKARALSRALQAAPGNTWTASKTSPNGQMAVGVEALTG